jgi:hypothetical protein
VDGDGHLDLGVADRCHGLFVFLGNGAGGWRMTARPPRAAARDLDLGTLPVPPGATAGHEDLQFGDVNGDGRTDLLAVGSSRGGLSLLLGDGRGGWTRDDAGLPEGFGRDVELGDIDRDGRLDIAAAFLAAVDPVRPAMSRRLPVVWLNDGTGDFRPASDGLPDSGTFRSVALGDVDGDGLLDLAAAGLWDGGPPLRVYLGDGGRRWKPAGNEHPELEPEAWIEEVELADLDRDGRLDLVAVSRHDAGIRIWRGDGAGRWTACPDTGLPRGRTELSRRGLAVADVNGDGRPDLATGFGSEGSGRLEVWAQR